MKFAPPLQQAVLLKRYKRFLADVTLDSGEQTTIHCPNTGSMKNCILEGSPCWFSTSANPKRKYPYTWEIATTPAGALAGINTGRSNALVVEAVETGVITELQGYETLRTEVAYGAERSRIDILLQGRAGETGARCYVEVKNVTLEDTGGRGLFPDAVSARGTKHLRELMGVVAGGDRAVLLYCVQHTDIRWVEPADTIDPHYGETLREAVALGVEVVAYRASLSPLEIVLQRRLEVKI
ncbi:DNA/RNA nuclease SfsA [Exilibacterium tricleocarpae]|uniref:Sugar fermentation stimulation protein homolog n=1 Tax=Exilibacterium tricleocarpae TaxID=2591008 RepID=A0A545STL2_9GAMM|nr:DNA/RNA nuclease SfsA [Exilibacterium tricleocarpae]TQV68291.1 DNA/RNA nuclease SfsA [Exilibacterium tricleocarpae]